MWEDFLRSMEYPVRIHMISSQAVDIICFLTIGLLQIILIYRDKFKGKYPCLLWQVGIEGCEHTFGICRQLVKDFNALDFQYMAPKLYVRLCEHFLFRSTSLDGKARSSGYNHMYADSSNINVAAVCTYPSDDNIKDASFTAHTEAVNLWQALGVNIIQPMRTPFPSPDAWFLTPSSAQSLEGDNDSDDDDNDIMLTNCHSDVSQDDATDESSELQQLMDKLEEITPTHQDSQALNRLAYAAASVTVQESMALYVFFLKCLLACQ